MASATIIMAIQVTTSGVKLKRELEAGWFQWVELPMPAVLTIHNAAHQGVFPKEELPGLGIGWDAFNVDGIEFYGGINLLKQGLLDHPLLFGWRSHL